MYVTLWNIFSLFLPLIDPQSDGEYELGAGMRLGESCRKDHVIA